MVSVSLRTTDPSDKVTLLPPGMTVAEGALDLVPVPIVMVGISGARLFFEAHNSAFVRAGMGGAAERSPLVATFGPRIVKFLGSDATRDVFAWEAGNAVEGRHFRVTIARVTHRCEPVCLITLVDETGEVRTQQNLRREMTTDSLTGLPNRGGFTDLLEARIEAGQTRYAVLMIDLDRFSRVNACLGSLAGDELLITVARRIKSALRGNDVLARIVGDEFGVLMGVDEDAAEAEQVARRISGALATPFRLSDYEIRVSCAIGTALGSEEVGNAEDVIRHAQFAMKRAKTSGRLEAYQTQAFDVAREQFAMETALRRAIERRQLTLYYQPIVDLATGRVIAFESLARWTDENGKLYSPTEFIPVAEECGLIVPLGRWALDEAIRTLAVWDTRAGGCCGIAVAVNLSAIQLQRDAIAPLVETTLKRHGMAGNRLKLELTESALIQDPDRTAQVLHALKALGTTLAMDDFGTGYSNLAYLQKLPIDILKIDRSFVTGMLADRDKIAIVRAVLSLATALGMKTVAEGIESEELGQTLAALGCTYGQGYAYARPLEAEAAYAFLTERNA